MAAERILDPITIDLNCDYGETFGGSLVQDDVALLQYVSSINIACGAHSGDPDVMRRALAQARTHSVAVGAHPGFPDISGFGRRLLHMSPDEICNSVLAQIGALAALARAEGLTLTHVKAHGALYNHAAHDLPTAAALARAVATFDPALILVGLSGSAMITAGEQAGLRVAREAFVDRAYATDGSLRSRRLDGAVILDNQQALAQALSIARDGTVMSYDGTQIAVPAETLCLHGDTPGARERAAVVRQGLAAAGVVVRRLGNG